jgi:hypothetical protein
LNELLYSSKRNLHELKKLINRLFERYSRILVVRIDLRYKKEVAQLIPIEAVQLHRELLLEDRRFHPQVFDGMLGYAWGLECSKQDNGYHYHFLALYNGAIRQEDIGIGLAIRDRWQEITNGYGECYISNFDKEKLDRDGDLGIGMIHRDNVKLRINLIEKVATYITKKCTIFTVESGRTDSGEFRTFGKSWMPKPIDPNVPRRGRPPLAASGKHWE